MERFLLLHLCYNLHIKQFYFFFQNIPIPKTGFDNPVYTWTREPPVIISMGSAHCAEEVLLIFSFPSTPNLPMCHLLLQLISGTSSKSHLSCQKTSLCFSIAEWQDSLYTSSLLLWGFEIFLYPFVLFFSAFMPLLHSHQLDPFFFLSFFSLFSRISVFSEVFQK